MDRRPIGVFDSGLGGLTAVKKLMEVLPHENIIYFGDTGRVPYGSRSKETIIKYTRQDIAFLETFSPKAILAACGTVSTTALDTVAPACSLPIFGVAEAAARKASRVTKNKKIGLIGTLASIRSKKYEELIHKFLPDAEIFGCPCPLFVPLVENGRSKRGDIVIETVAREYLTPLCAAGVDTLILGCTHYPILQDVISDTMGPQVTLVDPGAEGANFLGEYLRENGLLTDSQKAGENRYYVSDNVDTFSALAAIFLEKPVEEKVSLINADKF